MAWDNIDKGETVTDEQPESTGNAERDRLMGQAYSAATKELREHHKDEFNEFYKQQLKARGINWEPRKSKQDQALDQIVELLTTYPEIGEKLADRLTHGDLSTPPQ